MSAERLTSLLRFPSWRAQRNSFVQWLQPATDDPWRRSKQRHLEQLLEELRQTLRERPLVDAEPLDQALMRLLLEQIGDLRRRRAQLAAERMRFEAQSNHLQRHSETDALLLDYSARLGATSTMLRRDRRALNKGLDGAALNDRQEALVTTTERKLRFRLQCLAQLCDNRPLLFASGALEQTNSALATTLQHTLEQLFGEPLPGPVQVETIRVLAAAYAGRPRALPQPLRNRLLRAALDTSAATDVQCSALQASFRLVPEQAERVTAMRFAQPAEDPDLFVRARLVTLWREQLDTGVGSPGLAERIARDPAALVRQRLAEHLPGSPLIPQQLQFGLLVQLAADPVPAVAGIATISLAELEKLRPSAGIRIRDRLCAQLNETLDVFVMRCTLRAMESLAQQLAARTAGRGEAPVMITGAGVTDARTAVAPLLEALAEQHARCSDLRVRRWCSATRERILVAVLPSWQAAHQQLAQHIEQQREIDLRALPEPLEEAAWMRVLAVIAQSDQHLAIERRGDRLQVDRGHRFGFRLWRLIHEWRHPSPDKRQGFRHTVGRRFRGTLRAPSALMAEVSPTRVPGEPLIQADEDGWRPYLPLVDECLEALNQDPQPVAHQIYTSEGVTRILPPSGSLQQLRAWWQLTRHYVRYAGWRNWQGQDDAATTYIERLRALGFRIEFTAHDDPVTRRHWHDSSVARFFQQPNDQPAGAAAAGTLPAGLSPAAAAAVTPLVVLPWLGELWNGFRRHAASAYENSLTDLGLFLGIAAIGFLGVQIVRQLALRAARSRLPLVIGGWGTRGKSGTERLKAAMLAGAGYAVFSKTTGCEAMFVVNRPFRKLREFFLFRPYDKATIWEQANMVQLAARLEVDVFLWECMGLTPSYVRVLQHDWMRDDLATITNTFPDHEDLQGPAGINIPQVMCEFIPRNARLITTEEKMLPLLAQDASAKQTQLDAVDWLQIGALTPDVLERFPYEEHPNNIALVLKLAERLHIDRDLALKAMADEVVLDLGVLREYPTARVADRSLTFVMGMSANERFGALSNWERMGFSQATVAAAPTQWTATLINNRADRVSRSQIFARLLVEDIAVDQNLLIGTNLKGLLGYLESSWKNHMAEYDLWGQSMEDAGNAKARERFASACAKRKIALTPTALQQRLSAVCSTATDLEGTFDKLSSSHELRTAATALPEGAARHWCQQLIDEHETAARLAEQIDKADLEQRAALNDRVRQQLWTWFNDRLVVINEPQLSGDALCRRVINAVPPGLSVRLMGMQNIKGTGLDFVYLWQDWDAIATACDRLLGADTDARNAALDELLARPHWNLLATRRVEQTLQELAHASSAFDDSTAARLLRLGQRLDAAPPVLATAPGPGANHRRRWFRDTLRQILVIIEALLDAGDAVKRRRRADRIYAALAQTRISDSAAIDAIKGLNKRQKGGWLQNILQ